MSTTFERMAKAAMRQCSDALEMASKCDKAAFGVETALRAASEADGVPEPIKRFYLSAAKTVHSRMIQSGLAEEPMSIETSDGFYIAAMVSVIQDAGITCNEGRMWHELRKAQFTNELMQKYFVDVVEHVRRDAAAQAKGYF